MQSTDKMTVAGARVTRGGSAKILVRRALAAATVAASLAIPSARGQSCEPEIAGAWSPQYGAGWDMALAGDVILVGVSSGGHDSGLWVYGKGGPAAHLYMPDAFGVAASGTLAAVVGVRSGLRMVDISDPTTPRGISAIALSESYGVAIDGTTAFVADGVAGLAVVDIADPRAPRVVATLDTPHIARRITVADDIAIIADSGGGVRIVDVHDPSAPVEVGAFATVAAAMTAKRVGHLAYVATAGAGMLILDVSDPSSAVEVGRLESPEYVSDIALAPPLAWLLGGEGTHPFGEDLVAVDIRDPATPVAVGRSRIYPPGLLFAMMNAAVALREDGAYVLSSQLHLGAWDHQFVRMDISSCALCLADCDGSGTVDFADFLCFQDLYAAGDPGADCDASGSLDFFDFLCFSNQFAAGCP